VFARAIAANELIKITDPAARRYFLTIDEAVDLLLAAAAEPRGLLAAALPAPQFIADLARFMAANLAPKRETQIEFTQLRSGDKEAEKLWSTAESMRSAHAAGLLAIESAQPDREMLSARLAALLATVEARDTAAAIAQLCALVPEYKPSETVRMLVTQSAARIAQ
jgi:O-antigen biosynthesis protein WbqV